MERTYKERAMGLEPTISCLEGKRSTTELRPHAIRAGLLYPKRVSPNPRDALSDPFRGRIPS